MADNDRAVVGGRELVPDGRAPARVSGVVLVRQARVADFVPVPKLSAQAVDQSRVPVIVYARTAALDEQDLPGSWHAGTSFIAEYFAALVAMAAILAAASAGRYYFVITLGERVVADIRSDVFSHVTTLSPSLFDTAQ